MAAKCVGRLSVLSTSNLLAGRVRRGASRRWEVGKLAESGMEERATAELDATVNQRIGI
jgi:hypothetical protein